jgi:2-polyprenyl-6-hydroxyphenyl methylase/3-demethylubiquinone-9 3-methyltransferase
MTIDNRYYDSLGDAWWDPEGPMGLLLRMNRFRYRYFRRVLDAPKGLKLLDVGCGGGFLAEAFADDGADVYGLDLSTSAVRAAREHATRGGLRLRVVSGRAESLPFASGIFDAVFLVDVLEHLEDFLQALAESSRVLKPGGLLLYETANRTLLSRVGAIWVMEHILRKIPVHSHDWKMFIQPLELEKNLSDVGLENVETMGLGLKHGIIGFIYRYITGKDPWIFEINEDKRISYLGYAIKRNDPQY